MLITAPIAGGDGPTAFDGIGKTVDFKALRVRRVGADVVMEGDL
jgi:hypothetical protein